LARIFARYLALTTWGLEPDDEIGRLLSLGAWEVSGHTCDWPQQSWVMARRNPGGYKIIRVHLDQNSTEMSGELL
jgi:hypothetical protein